VSRGHALGSDYEPDLFVKGALTYRAQMNAENPLGTVMSLEHVIRSLDRRAQEEKEEIERQEKALAEYKAQLNRPFEHEERLKDLLAKQAQLNAALDLDKHERQVAQETAEIGQIPLPASFVGRLQAQERIAARGG
jgi:predicted RNase H-like nuclease (RuvC/YqgF family)